MKGLKAEVLLNFYLNQLIKAALACRGIANFHLGCVIIIILIGFVRVM
jgi:hypothetical protein